DEAVDIVNRLQDEFPDNDLEHFLRFHDITEEQFWETAEKFRNQDIWEKVDGQWQLKYKLEKLNAKDEK
ncbi:hypothetical protein, partial [Vibrio sinaloensis]